MTSDFLSCELLDHRPLNGQENMAIDARMLEQAVAGAATVRTYQWSSPTVSVGYFQAKSMQIIPARFSELPFVERLSGGGAILHDQELTYSLALPKQHPLTKNPSQIYNVVHEAIIEILHGYGIQSQLRGEAAFPEKPFLCFSRGDERDVVIAADKIVGSAQRRRQGAVLQHGSLLLKRSSHAQEFPGILELTGLDLSVKEVVAKFLPLLCQKLELKPVTDKKND